MRSSITRFSSGRPWEAVVGYCRAVRAGDWIHVAGTTAVDEEGNVLFPGDAAAQTRAILGTIERALADAGAVLEQVVRTRMFVVDIGQWEAIGREHGRVFGDIRPAATMVEVAALIDPGLLVEIEAVAYIGP